MEGVVVSLSAFAVMALVAVIAGVIAAVAAVTGFGSRREKKHKDK